jgi:hypothetical protein
MSKSHAMIPTRASPSLGVSRLRQGRLRDTCPPYWNFGTRARPRQSVPDSEWIERFALLLHGLIDLRVRHVRLWLDSNLERFQASHSPIEDLLRKFEDMVIEIKANVQLCGVQCASCHLVCIRSRLHEGDHDCNTMHKCVHDCTFCEGGPKPCSSR